MKLFQVEMLPQQGQEIFYDLYMLYNIYKDKIDKKYTKKCNRKKQVNIEVLLRQFYNIEKY